MPCKSLGRYDNELICPPGRSGIQEVLVRQVLLSTNSPVLERIGMQIRN